MLIGHRGAAGLALENTTGSFVAAQKHHVDAIELDVRKTMDGQLVVCHDPDTSRIAGVSQVISLTTYDALRQITLKDGESKLLKLSDALKTITSTPVIIEVKDEGCMPILSKLIASSHESKYAIASFMTKELAIIKTLRPNIKTYGLTYSRPFRLISTAGKLKLDGVGLSLLSLNPMSYKAARKLGLEVYVYTINSRLVARLVGKIYPDISICTDRPDRIKT